MKKTITFLVAALLIGSLALPVMAAGDARLVDDAALLTQTEAEQLTELLDETSEELNFEIIIVTLDDFGGGNVERFTEQLYDEVYGKDQDGVILLVSMAERDWCISGNGEGKEIFTADHIDAVANVIIDDLSEGEYAAAFEGFVKECAYYIDGERNGYPFEASASLLIACVVGLLAALIVTGIMRSQLKSVQPKRSAQDYVTPGSLQVTVAKDLYLYRTLDRVKRANTSSSGSSGSSHSTRSGKF